MFLLNKRFCFGMMFFAFASGYLLLNSSNESQGNRRPETERPRPATGTQLCASCGHYSHYPLQVLENISNLLPYSGQCCHNCCTCDEECDSDSSSISSQDISSEEESCNGSIDLWKLGCLLCKSIQKTTYSWVCECCYLRITALHPSLGQKGR